MKKLKSLEITHSRLTVFEAIEAAAIVGAPPPTHHELLDLTGLPAGSHISNAISWLIRKGLISVEYRKSVGQRKFTITESGQSTDWSSLKGISRGDRFKTPSVRSNRRPCITCGTQMFSEGPHNRMCPTCRNSPSSYETSYRIVQ